MLNKNSKLYEAFRYSIYFLLLLILCNTQSYTLNCQLPPFGFAFFVALIYCKQNFSICAPLFIVANMVINPSINTLIISISPCLVFSAAYLIHFKIKKPIKLPELNILTIISLIPFIVIELKGTAINLGLLFSFIFTIVLTNFFIIGLYAILVRGLKYRLNYDEVAAISIIIAGLGLGIYRISVSGFTPFFFLASFIILFLQGSTKITTSLIFAILFGLGASIEEVTMSIISALVLSAAVAAVFHKSSRLISGFSYIFSIVVSAYYFKAFTGNNEFIIISSVIGVLIYDFLPNKYLRFIKENDSSFGTNNSARVIVSRNNLAISNKLTKVSKSFKEMGNNVIQSINEIKPISSNLDELSSKMYHQLCDDCIMKDKCDKYSGGQIISYMKEIIEGTISRGRTTILDMPPFIAGNCHKVNAIMNNAIEIVEKYNINKSVLDSTSCGKMIIAEQMKEIGGLLSNLAEDTKLNVNFNTNMENRIIEELSYNNIICSQAIVYNDNKNIPHINITVREKDANKKGLANILSKLFKTRLTAGNNNENVYNGTVTIEFVMEPVYDIIYGTKNIIKDDSPISGDTKSIKRIAVDRVLVAVSDGMGSGERANKSSINAISMIENFYSAGFDNFSVLSLTNKLLTIGNDETFSALDVCLIDTRTGSADFIKLGSPTSFIKHKEDIETVDNTSLPIGIVEDLYPKTQRKMLTSDDLVLWVTDGIYDTLGDNAIRRILTQTNSTNPQLVCDNIINEVLCNPKIQDDCSCIAVRLFKNN